MAETHGQSTLFGEEPAKGRRAKEPRAAPARPVGAETREDAPIEGAFVRVVVERGIEESAGYTYRCDEPVRVGDRVRVPLGRGNTPTGGVVVEAGGPELVEGVDPARVKSVIDVTPTNLSAAMIRLARWMSAYYIAPLGMVLSAMVPAAVKKGTGVRKERVYERIEAGVDAAVFQTLSKRTRELLETVMALPGAAFPAEPKRLAAEVGLKTAGPLKRLEEIGALREVVRHKLEARGWSYDDGAAREPAASRHVLNAAQRAAVDGIGARLGEFGVHLVRGVTGSGKTEVYLQLIERVLDAGKSAIVLVPEISLTPQTSARFLSRFAVQGVCVLHSGLSASQRHAEWERAARGSARVVVGARSAVFAPLDKLGLIVVDEEHDTSYKQDQVPRYHGRDAAIKRGQVEGCPVVLGSATPSLESWANAGGDVKEVSSRRAPSAVEHPSSSPEGRTDVARGAAPRTPLVPAPPPPTAPRADEIPAGPTTAQWTQEMSGTALAEEPPRPWHRYTLWELPERVVGRMPPVEVVDIGEERKAVVRENPALRPRQWSIGPRLAGAVEMTLRAGGQVILLMNRRGFAHYIACVKPSCGWVMQCDLCDVRMVFHKQVGLPRGGDVACHHCLSRQVLPRVCPDCGGAINVFGSGTQRVEEEVLGIVERCGMGKEALIRADSDSMGGARDYFEALDRFARGEARVLLGTQMIAKGLDFPNVQLVGVVSADTALSLPDFRSGERTFQLISQVAGRAGRGRAGGRVIVQTMEPRNAAVVFAARHDYVGFAEFELRSRREWGLPPATRMARVVCRDENAVRAREAAGEIAGALRDVAREDTRVFGPMECPINRLHGRFRYAAEIIAPTAVELNRCLGSLRGAGLLVSDARTAVDVDPVGLL